ncbi:DUF6428 family protein [Chelativorans sp. AA-79]|uniref:DUF6428 family protein n=1 Tax=Chelativorans sp. AA-79 TaxID=3028735 RepID=UPI0023F73BDB|nr:DUF6428 family protein [Chelativorans sp. AA-79]WEX11049.1 DUF6428 family protein [Chelativorans sp. AA-79]
MNRHATPVFPADTSVDQLLAALAEHDSKPLVIDYAGRRVQPGYHVTEVKAGSFVTLDCGGRPDAWQETVLQVEDMPAREEGQTFMSVGKFRGILAKVDSQIQLQAGARMTFEVSRPDEPMQIFDVAGVALEGDAAVLKLAPRPAICKPRHRAREDTVTSCCAPASSGKCCA